MNWIKRAWQGEERLWKVFWIGILLGLVLQVASIAILYLLGSIPHLLSVGVEAIYDVWFIVAGWRCAFNTNWRFWGYTVRSLIGLSIIANMGILESGAEVRIARGLMAGTECAKEAKEYAERGSADLDEFKQTCMQNYLRDKTSLSSETADNVKLGQTSDSFENMSAYGKIDMHFIAQYIRAREGYTSAPFEENYKISRAVADNYNVVRLMSEPSKVYADFIKAMDPSNPESNAARLGQNGSRRIKFKSLVFLQPQVAEMHFTINERSDNKATPVQYNKVARIEFEYVKMNLTPDERFINPDGFLIMQYHLDDDSVQK